MSVKWMSPVSSSSSLTRQQRAQPSHRLSHSSRVISSRDFTRQNGAASASLIVIATGSSLSRGYWPPDRGSRAGPRDGKPPQRNDRSVAAFFSMAEPMLSRHRLDPPRAKPQIGDLGIEDADHEAA